MAKLYVFDEDSGDNNIASEFFNIRAGMIYFCRKKLNNVWWFFFCKNPITDKDITAWENSDDGKIDIPLLKVDKLIQKLQEKLNIEIACEFDEPNTNDEEALYKKATEQFRISSGDTTDGIRPEDLKYPICNAQHFINQIFEVCKH